MRGSNSGMSSALSNLGIAYLELGDNRNALIRFQKSQRILENELENADEKARDGIRKQIASTHTNTGLVYKSIGDLDLAMEHNMQSLAIYNDLGLPDRQANVLNNIAEVAVSQGQLDSACRTHFRALTLREDIGDLYGAATSHGGLGIVYSAMDSLDKAERHYQVALEMFNQVHDPVGRANMNLGLGEISLRKGDYTEAKKFCLSGLSISEETKNPSVISEACNCMYESLKGLGDKASALDYFERHKMLEDSLVNQENTKKILKQNYQFEFEKQHIADSLNYAKNREIDRAEKQTLKAQLKKEETQRYALVGGAALVLLFAAFMVNRFRITRKQKNVIEEQKGKVDRAYDELEEKNREIVDSINYAQRIQAAILPPDSLVKEHLDNSFVLYKPKDIVAGDFYWMETYAPAPSSSASASESSPKGDLSTAHQFPLEGDTGGKVHKCTYIAAADCTGHGVPGAMVSVVCSNALSKAVVEEKITDPGKILDRARELVIEHFGRSEEEIKDGMDVALVKIVERNNDLSKDQKPPRIGDPVPLEGDVPAAAAPLVPREGDIPAPSGNSVTIEYAGANNPLWVVTPSGSNLVSEPDTTPSDRRSGPPGGGGTARRGPFGSPALRQAQQSGGDPGTRAGDKKSFVSSCNNWKLLEIKPNKQPIGRFDNPLPFDTHTVELQQGDTIYIFSDGFADQFGGAKGKKFKSANFKKLLLSVQGESMSRQRELIEEAFEKWKGPLEQLDDVCVIGVRL